MEGKKNEGANERTREERLIQVQKKTSQVGGKNAGPAAQTLVRCKDEDGEEIK